MRINFAYHSQIDGQFERTIQFLEDLLKICVLNHLESCDEMLSLVKFTYNNSYHISIGSARVTSTGHWEGEAYIRQNESFSE